MRVLMSLGVLAVLTAPAFAQDADLKIDPAIADSCLATVKEQFGKDEDANYDICIGKAASACMESDNGSTTVGMSTCMGSELDYWDAKLNASYKAVMAQAEAVDKEMADLGSAAEKQVPFLKEMQRKWISYRDAACSYERSRWGGGSGSGPAEIGCRMDLTAQQYLRLHAYEDQ